jgi:nitrogenase molybdenum-iron protein alpha/beta subunit
MRAAGTADPRDGFLRYCARLARPTAYDPNSPTLGLSQWDYDLFCAIYDNASTATELLKEKDCDIFVGGVKERPIAYKLGVGFCDHNHERKLPLEGFADTLKEIETCFGALKQPTANPIAPPSPKRSPKMRSAFLLLVYICLMKSEPRLL